MIMMSFVCGASAGKTDRRIIESGMLVDYFNVVSCRYVVNVADVPKKKQDIGLPFLINQLLSAMSIG